jgi:acetyltransferase-like isoleucine patch superfamily enzyme
LKAADEVGLGRMFRFGLMTLLMIPYRCALVPPIRSALLRLFGARIGRRVVLHDLRFFNLYRRGLAGLNVGDECFVGDECLFDLAEAIELQAQVTLAERVLILTHTNVGYRDHPLQVHFPAMAAAVVVETGAFLGANVTILPGLRIGARSFVAAGSVVTQDVPPDTLVAGVPARTIRRLGSQPAP